jgi:amidase
MSNRRLITTAPLGFGTDIAGSIRIPAAFNGLHGIRPSEGRLPYSGMANSMDGQNSVLSVVGPLATSADSLRLVMKALLEKKPWLYDPMVNELPWREEQEREILEMADSTEKSKLCFGVLRTDGIVNPQPPVRRAIDIVIKALEDQGHKVIDWQPPSHKPIHDTIIETWNFDAGKDIKSAFALSGEPMAPQVSFFGDLDKEVTASEIAALNVKLRELKKQYLDYWTGTESVTETGRPVDAIICPLAPFPAATREGYLYYGYSSWVNALDYTSVTVPICNVDKNIDKVDGNYSPIDDKDGEVQRACELFHLHSWLSGANSGGGVDDPEVYDGAHVSLQFVGRRLQEEKMIAIAELVGKAVGK